ncbi:hypothetical protein F5882DRAFT_78688 [Hyaloscypha sp. PMI_1271]|nr:hypothetical protein F5882DRAFT_78688 [Hyaloscypha sp. PMI_1271]
MEHLIYYYCTVCKKSSEAWQIENGSPVTGFNRIATEFMPFCLTDVMAFQSILFTAETGLRNDLGENPWSLRAHKLSMECLELLRAKMAEPNLVVSDAMIATVVNLAVSELLYIRNPMNFENHMTGLRQMVKLRGGLNKFDGILKEVLNWLFKLYSELSQRARHTHEEDKSFTIQKQRGFPAATSLDDWSSLSYETITGLSVKRPRTFFV